MVGHYIDYFIHVSRHRWDVVYFTFDKYRIYEVEGSSKKKGFDLSSSEDWHQCIYDLDTWHHGNDMIICLFQDDSLQHTHEYFQPPSCSHLDGYQAMAILDNSKSHPTKRKNFHLESFHNDL